MAFELKSYQFRKEREASWQALEELVSKADKGGLGSLGPDDLYRLPVLYRAALSSLSVARAISLDKNVVEFLESLTCRAYIYVYGSKRPFMGSVFDFFSTRFPDLVRSLRWFVLVATAVTVAGVACGWVMTSAEPDRYYSFVDESMASGRSPSSTRAELEKGLYEMPHEEESSGTVGMLTGFASFLFTHNARIGLACFALGFVAGVPVLLLLFINGLSLGAMAAIHADKGLAFDFWAWVLPHGVTELLAVIICGAAGLSVGRALVFPGEHRRIDNLAIHGRQAGAVVVGCVALFLVAALIEGFFRQLVPVAPVRAAVAIVTSMVWVAYFGFAGKRG